MWNVFQSNRAVTVHEDDHECANEERDICEHFRLRSVQAFADGFFSREILFYAREDLALCDLPWIHILLDGFRVLIQKGLKCFDDLMQ